MSDIKVTYVGPPGRAPGFGWLERGRILEIDVRNLESANWVADRSDLEQLPKVKLGVLAQRLALEPQSGDTKSDILDAIMEVMQTRQPPTETDAADDGTDPQE